MTTISAEPVAAAPTRAIGNAEVLETLDYWLGRAAKGDVNYLALAAVQQRGQVAYDYAGAKGLEREALAPIKTLQQELEMICEARRVGPRNMSLDESYVEWDCVGTPVCWDFLIWLESAEMTRRRYNAPAPLRVYFSRKEQLDDVSRDFFENVFRPLLPLIGAVEDLDAKGGRHNPIYVPQEIVTAALAGEKVPILQAPQRAREATALWLHGMVPVTITLREAKHWNSRNSNLEAWLHLARDIEASGHPVVFVRDTCRARDPLPGFRTYPMASVEVGARMALYESAHCNLFVSNGPAGLGLFSDRPYLYFLECRRDEDYHANGAEWWLRSNGISPGEQWPWALPSQRMIWKPDTYENISEAWERHQPLLHTPPPARRETIAPAPIHVIAPPAPSIAASSEDDSSLAVTWVDIFDRRYQVYGSPTEGWFGILKQAHQYTEFDLDHLRPLIAPDAVCIDAGANLGMMTLAMAALAPQGEVWSFEPDETTFKALSRTVQASGYGNIRIAADVLGAAGCRGEFVEDPAWRSSSHFIPSANGRHRAVSIDELSLDRVDLIKIDVEGAELDVLEGAKDTLGRYRPTVILEFNCFAFVHYRGILPRDALKRIQAIFPHIGYFEKRVGRVVPLDDPELFLRNNMLGGLVDDLICTWET